MIPVFIGVFIGYGLRVFIECERSRASISAHQRMDNFFYS